MKPPILLLLLCTASLIGTGCKRSEIQVLYWGSQNAVKRSEGRWVLVGTGGDLERVQDGVWRTWYENGYLESEMTFVRGRRVGQCRYWYDNGQLRQMMSFNSMGRVDSEIVWWKKNGKLLKTSSMKNGTGSDFYFNDDYSIRMEIKFVDGEVQEEILYSRDGLNEVRKTIAD